MAAHGLVATFQAFLDAVNSKNWDEVQRRIRPAATATYDENRETRDELVGRLVAAAERGDQLGADSWTADEAAQSVAARLVTDIKNAPDGAPSRVWDLVLVFFEEGSISRFYQITSQTSRDPGLGSWAPEVTSKPSKSPLSASELDALYREYIYSYNDGTMPAVVPRRWAKEVSVLGNKMPVELAPGILDKVIVPVIAGLKYEVEEMVIDVGRQQVAVRLALEGVPENGNLQKNGAGREVKVHEHALYGYEDGKVAWAWPAQAFDMSPPPGPAAGGAP